MEVDPVATLAAPGLLGEGPGSSSGMAAGKGPGELVVPHVARKFLQLIAHLTKSYRKKVPNAVIHSKVDPATYWAGPARS